jgi:hypothetical protein
LSRIFIIPAAPADVKYFSPPQRLASISVHFLAFLSLAAPAGSAMT